MLVACDREKPPTGHVGGSFYVTVSAALRLWTPSSKSTSVFSGCHVLNLRLFMLYAYLALHLFSLLTCTQHSPQASMCGLSPCFERSSPHPVRSGGTQVNMCTARSPLSGTDAQADVHPRHLNTLRAWMERLITGGGPSSALLGMYAQPGMNHGRLGGVWVWIWWCYVHPLQASGSDDVVSPSVDVPLTV
ncbi:hypothetical protein C8Q78DRAFT_372691 [Trametes maxima]|nr:hypothetical protein C8Q78DRAFT_372691 [Trametes maxima]